MDVIVADGKYGNQRFLGGLSDEACGLVVRLRSDWALWSPPPPYEGRDWPVTWSTLRFQVAGDLGRIGDNHNLYKREVGRVRLCTWQNLHARQDADTAFHVLLAKVWQYPAMLWLAYRGTKE